VTGTPTAAARGSVTANLDATWAAVTVVLAVPDTGASLSDLTVTDCLPPVANVTWNEARPFRNATGIIGKFAAGSLLVTEANPLNDDSGLPAASTATAVTVIGTPARTCDGIVIRNDSRITGSVTGGFEALPDPAAGGGAMRTGESVLAGATGGITAMPMPLSMPRDSSCSAMHAGKRAARAFRRRDVALPNTRSLKALMRPPADEISSEDTIGAIDGGQ
jgi:hypothetical protein